ncbi:hypothetical protein CIPAW_09G134700 [Carya illinoinensis]|uniref:Uncharacterized protein n=1 Tax=Carya illinoinensis TaxID=32201 RepID=A0A8T1PHG4_CARIL|nr:hypothetical protein CIPAW_09G134700 [Carya illinoinensis]
MALFLFAFLRSIQFHYETKLPCNIQSNYTNFTHLQALLFFKTEKKTCNGF